MPSSLVLVAQNRDGKNFISLAVSLPFSYLRQTGGHMQHLSR